MVRLECRSHLGEYTAKPHLPSGIKLIGSYTELTRFVARGPWILLAMPTLSEDVESS